jgi:cytochrome c oxidase assembly protein subunit 15
LALFTKRQKGLRIFLGLGLILLTLFQAWWGSMVVATNIVPWVLTVHMVIAALMILWQIIIISVWSDSTIAIPRKLKIIAFIGLVFFLFQIILGTQVRQIVDHWLDSSSRNELIFQDFRLFLSHRTLALAIVIFSIILGSYAFLKKINLIEIYLFAICVLAEALVGKVLADFNLPALLQPIHLLLAMVSFGCLARIVVNYQIDKT